MIIRYMEICPKCGQWDPWRQYAKKLTGLGPSEVARKYVICRRCSHHEVISVIRRDQPSPTPS